MFLAIGAVVWWLSMPDSPELQSSGPGADRAIAPQANSVSENRPGPSEEQHLADDPPPKLTVESPGEETLERRCLELAERDPRAAVSFAINTRASDTCPGLLENLVAQWATHDLQASHEWVLQQPPGESRDRLLARIAFAGSQSDPAAAARIVSDEMTPGQRQTEAAISVLHQWALRDVEAAAAWAFSFPEGIVRQRALDEIEAIRNLRLTEGL